MHVGSGSTPADVEVNSARYGSPVQVNVMNYKLVCVFLTALLPGLVFGQAATSYQCSFENLQRRIEILSDPGVPVPCEVHYYKDSETPGAKQVLWTATSEAGYCEARTEEFVAKLREWGWVCVAGAASESAMDSESATDAEPAAEPMSDDTEALAPAEE